MVIAVSPTGDAKSLVDTLHAWLLRGENRKIKIKTKYRDRSLEIEYSPTSMNLEELGHLIDSLTVITKDG